MPRLGGYGLSARQFNGCLPRREEKRKREDSGIYKPVCSELVPEPRNRQGCGRKSIWHKNTLGCRAVLLILVCVAAAGLLVVIQ